MEKKKFFGISFISPGIIVAGISVVVLYLKISSFSSSAIRSPIDVAMVIAKIAITIIVIWIFILMMISQLSWWLV